MCLAYVNNCCLSQIFEEGCVPTELLKKVDFFQEKNPCKLWGVKGKRIKNQNFTTSENSGVAYYSLHSVKRGKFSLEVKTLGSLQSHMKGTIKTWTP